MKSKILTLVLNKKSSSIIRKRKGNVSSLIWGFMFLTVVILLMMFNYRVTTLSEVIYNIDDMLTASTLGMAVPNLDAFSSSDATTEVESGQLVFQDSANGVQARTKYYKSEYNVVKSEENSFAINKGRYALEALLKDEEDRMTWDSAKLKTDTDIDKMTRVGYTGSSDTKPADEFAAYVNDKNSYRAIKNTDAKTIASASNLLDLVYTNLTQSKSSSKKIDSLSMSELNKLSISKDELQKNSFIGNYVDSGMDIVRLQFYDVYRYTLAKRHVYASPYISYTVNGVSGYTWDGYKYDEATGKTVETTATKIPVTTKSGVVSTNAVKDMVNATQVGTDGKTSAIKIEISGDSSWTSYDPNTTAGVDKFKDMLLKLYPSLIVRGRVPEDISSVVKESDYEVYDNLYKLWKEDYDNWKAKDTKQLIFWEDTGKTYQKDWWASGNDLNKIYGYMWNNNSSSAIEITDNTLITDDLGRKVLPIEGVTTYMYTRGNSSIQSTYKSLASSADKDKQLTGIKGQHTSFELGDYNLDGTIDDTATSSGEYKNRKIGRVNGSTSDKYMLFNSSIYVEVAYTLCTFPTSSNNNIFNIDTINTTPIVQERLVSLRQTEQ